MRYIIFVVMECKNLKNGSVMITLPSATLNKGSLCRVQCQKHSETLEKRNQFWPFSQLCRVPGKKTLGKEFLIFFALPSVVQWGTRQSIFF
jgi:hypothetical protein